MAREPRRGPPARLGTAALVSRVAPRKKRLNIEIPADLHARFKADCARRGRDMTTVLTEMLRRRCPSAEGKG